jgi:hypothetical protein
LPDGGSFALRMRASLGGPRMLVGWTVLQKIRHQEKNESEWSAWGSLISVKCSGGQVLPRLGA